MADMTNYTQLSVNQLDADAVTEYVIQKGKLVYRTDNASPNASDTDNVHGVPAAQIAVAVDPQHRDTVNDSNHLGGQPPEYYLSRNEGNDLTATQQLIRTRYNAELSDLRDEVYQLKNQLAGSGFIRNDGQYCGYHDLFRKNDWKHEYQKLGDVSTVDVENPNQITIDDPAVFKALDVYDYVALKNTGLNEYRVCQVTAKDDDGITVTLDRTLEKRFASETYELYKSAGTVYNGMFAFAMPPEDQVGANEYYSGVSDDSFNVYQKVAEPNKGYAYNVKVPEGKTGFLADIEVCLRAYGKPGALMCYVIDERDLPNFKNPSQAEADYRKAQEQNTDAWHFFAKSNPFHNLMASQGKRYCKFSFKSEQDTYPLLPQPQTNETIRYVIIVELLSGDKDNYYNLLFLQHKNPDGTLSDLQLNNTTYYYTRRGTDDADEALTSNENINAMDMFYQVHTLELNEQDPVPNAEGVYTAKIYLHNAIASNKARVTLRIRREGIYAAEIQNSPEGVTTQPVTLVNKAPDSGIRTLEDLTLNNEIRKPVELRNGDADISEPVPVIIGDSITKIQGLAEDSVTLGKPCMVWDQDEVFRAAYHVAVKAYKLQFNPKTGIITYSDPVRFNLPLHKVYRDVDAEDPELSNRLVYETDLDDEYNYFELQIAWENNQLSMYPEVAKSQMGAIRELTASFGKIV